MVPLTRFTAAACLAAAAMAAPGAAWAIELLPHRAVYEMGLDRAAGASGITDVSGRLVFEVLGSACEGYSVNMRFVSQIDGEETSTTSDLRSATFEEADGSMFRFVTHSYLNGALSESTDGTATRTDAGTEVRLTAPEQARLSLDRDVLFPTEHIFRVLEAAREGETLLAADVFNGTDGGKAMYSTAVIGERVPADPDLEGPGAEHLRDEVSWPVTIAYFDASEGGDETPTYESTYDLYANGVSRRIVLDYGRFAISGEMSSFEVVEQAECDAPAGD